MTFARMSFAGDARVLHLRKNYLDVRPQSLCDDVGDIVGSPAIKGKCSWRSTFGSYDEPFVDRKQCRMGDYVP